MILDYFKPLLRAATVPAVLVAACLAAGPAQASGAGLAERMAHLQRHTHKLQLSVEARNPRLVGFYVHEIEELAEGIRDEIPTYDGHPVGQLSAELLLPAVEALESPVESADWDAAADAFAGLLSVCNACHEATDHGYIRIVPAAGNPYSQDFSPAD